jgi:hypothetical protein
VKVAVSPIFTGSGDSEIEVAASGEFGKGGLFSSAEAMPLKSGINMMLRRTSADRKINIRVDFMGYFLLFYSRYQSNLDSGQAAEKVNDAALDGRSPKQST